MEHDLDALAQFALELAVTAGGILQKGRAEGFGHLETKSSQTDVVTEIDKASENYLATSIQEGRPHDSILGEEGTSVKGTSGVRWVIDPLDGTVNFTYGIPLYAVCIGIEIDNVRSIGVVYNPASQELYRAIRGRGAFCNDQPISVRPKTDLATALVATGFSYESHHRARQADVLRNILPLVRDIRRSGSAALDICSLAAGHVDAYYEFGIKPWDVTGADVIVTEAGAVITSFEGDRAELTAVAARPELQEQLRRLIAES